MIIYRPSDRIPVKVGKFTVLISPLSAEQRTQISSLTKLKAGKEVIDHAAMMMQTLKCTIKGIEGVEDATFADGSKFELEFDDSGELTKDGLTALYEVLGSKPLSDIVAKIISHSMDKDDIPGVKFELDKVIASKKKNATSQSQLST